MSDYIPYGKQTISQADINAVVDVLQSEYLTQGPQVPAFERAVTQYCNAQYAVACNSATSALHLACLALDVGAGDIVWTSVNTFVASSNSALYCGAKVDFIDIELTTGNLSIDALTAKLESAATNNQLPKVVIPVHFAGQSCDMKAISALSKKYGFKIIEDASHAIGGNYLDNKIGSCEYSDICVFSFHPVKIITSGEGGMALTNQANVAKKMHLLRSHGITRDPNEMQSESHGDWYYQQIELGFNYRMTDIHAALGLRQLADIDSWVEQRHQLAKRYNKAFANTQITPLKQNLDGYSAYHLYVVRLRGLDLNAKRRVFNALRKNNIGVNLHYIPVHLQPYYQHLGFNEGDYPVSEQYYKEAISLPLHPSLTKVEQDFVIEQLLACL
ncbi:UDP-4-amino-4,6-dideoxy-N-acetyl-beta-L-altrosamine transaminase [Motilimonas sp. E26]|uniref:UDP-4-amino-4, 6-dideoxy-N-acetyl-beta-L-altrosamine transaminase n=1 Tax=Motilimonas sp. E26 TaxID=2865674 RepID=UPI001E61CB41|nr:UDP-4-amino-4,6-dideoxy-N-acetyl-beta-L-altrosamine transaminase [Motilimonas sp. E26]MCE0556230.1 UDP-4-amino-4,6-dideoxy-N-acetyl-beta-L-altrosamine transaminase [Motilimonas sp. E26]